MALDCFATLAMTAKQAAEIRRRPYAPSSYSSEMSFPV